MKKMYSLGLLVLMLMLVVTVTVACGAEEPRRLQPKSPRPPWLTAGIQFKDEGNNVVYITDMPEPGMAFPISTSGDYAAKIWATDASGARSPTSPPRTAMWTTPQSSTQL